MIKQADSKMFSSEKKKKYMTLAFVQAKKAQAKGEVPIGAVIVDDQGQVIGQGYNRRELDQDATMHAEMIAIRQACQKRGSWRLNGCSLFVTLEPCPMCAGAIINARLSNVFFAALDPKAGAAGSVIDLLALPALKPHPHVIRGLFRAQGKEMLQEFFRQIRNQEKSAKKQQDSGKNNKNTVS